MSKSSAANRCLAPLKLFEVGNPLRAAGAGKSPVQVLLVDQDLKARVAGMPLPALPTSFGGKPGERVDLGTATARLIVIGCGKPGAINEEPTFWESAGAALIDGLRALRIEQATLAGALLPVAVDAAVAVRSFAIGATLASYRCTRYREQPPKDHFEVKSLGLRPVDWKVSASGRELGDAVNWARALVDAPANLLTPQSFAEEIKALKSLGVEVKVLDAGALERMGAGGLLAVGRSSINPPCLVVCQWRGKAGAGNDLGLVGKGLTFDGGGLNLKTAPGIAKMKFDMAGAAAVVGALRVLATRKAAVNVVAALPICENLIDADAFRPGDVIHSLAGLTIEVDNTDAEGRIVMADALTHLIKEHCPRLLVDVATLTGAIMVSLQEEYAGLFTTDEGLASALTAAGEQSSDLLWRMPLSKRQDYMIESDIADVKNVGAPGYFGAGTGSSTAAAKFLERFATGTRWAHLDIAGTAWSTRPKPGIPRGATGFGVRLLDAFVEQLPV